MWCDRSIGGAIGVGRVLYRAQFAQSRHFVFSSQDELGSVLLWSDAETTIRRLSAT